MNAPPDGAPSAAPVQIEIVVPARNEARRLPGGLDALCRRAATLPVRAEVIVVDSASTDATSDVVRRWPAGPVPVRLLRCDRPGKGLAVRTGLLATRAPFVGFCDADMATDLAALDVAVGLLAAGKPLVVGSRGLTASVVEYRHSAVRRAGAAVFRAMARRVVPGATDTQCGFKFFSGPLARAAALRLTTPGFAFDIELLAVCRQLGASVTEFPVHWRDMPGSTFSVPRHSAAALRDVVSIWLSQRPGRVASPAPAAAVPATTVPATPGPAATVPATTGPVLEPPGEALAAGITPA